MTSAEDVAREWLQCSDSVVMFGSAETIDTTVQSLAAIILRERKEAEARAEAAEAESVRLMEALEFYANPYGRRDEYGDPVRVPDFYSELEFGALAKETLKPRT